METFYSHTIIRVSDNKILHSGKVVPYRFFFELGDGLYIAVIHKNNRPIMITLLEISDYDIFPVKIIEHPVSNNGEMLFQYSPKGL